MTTNFLAFIGLVACVLFAFIRVSVLNKEITFENIYASFSYIFVPLFGLFQFYTRLQSSKKIKEEFEEVKGSLVGLVDKLDDQTTSLFNSIRGYGFCYLKPYLKGKHDQFQFYNVVFDLNSESDSPIFDVNVKIENSTDRMDQQYDILRPENYLIYKHLPFLKPRSTYENFFSIAPGRKQIIHITINHRNSTQINQTIYILPQGAYIEPKIVYYVNCDEFPDSKKEVGFEALSEHEKEYLTHLYM